MTEVIDISNHIRDVPPQVANEVVYLLGRLVTHNLTVAQFLDQLRSDVRPRYQQQSTEIVLGIVRAIESAEGSAFTDVPPLRRRTYLPQLDDFVMSRAGQGVDEIEVEEMLTALRSQA